LTSAPNAFGFVRRRAAGFAHPPPANPDSPTRGFDVIRPDGRNHRGFVDGAGSPNRIGADVLVLNTPFAGPALATSCSVKTSTSSLRRGFTATVTARWPTNRRAPADHRAWTLMFTSPVGLSNASIR